MIVADLPVAFAVSLFARFYGVVAATDYYDFIIVHGFDALSVFAGHDTFFIVVWGVGATYLNH